MLAQQLRQLRRERRWKQEELSSALGVSQTTVARWETGGRPAPRHLARIAKMLGLTVAEVAALAERTSDEDDEHAVTERLAAIEGQLATVTQWIREIREFLVVPGERADT